MALVVVVVGESTQTLNVHESGEYTVSVTDACGSQNESIPVEIVVVPSPSDPVIQWPEAVWANEPFSLISNSDATAWYDSELASIPFFTGSTLDTALSTSTEWWLRILLITEQYQQLVGARNGNRPIP